MWNYGVARELGVVGIRLIVAEMCSSLLFAFAIANVGAFCCFENKGSNLDDADSCKVINLDIKDSNHHLEALMNVLLCALWCDLMYGFNS